MPYSLSAIKNKAAAYALLLILILLVGRMIGHYVLPVYDDAFITYRYARNLASGIGFVYNPNEWVFGVTTPAFGLLAAFFFILHLPVPDAMVAVNIITDIGIALGTFYILNRAKKLQAAIIFVLFFSASPILTRICVGGMEENLFLFLSLASIFLFSQDRLKSSIVIASISIFFRPEGILTILLLLFLTAKDIGLKKFLTQCVLCSLFVAVPVLYLQSVYGSIIPQSILAKSSFVRQPLGETIGKLFFPEPLTVILFPFSLWGIWKIFRKDSFFTIFIQWICLYAAAYLIARPFVWSWYGEPIHYATTLFAAIGIYEVLKIKMLNKISPALACYGGSCIVLAGLGAVLFKSGESKVTKNIYRKLDVFWGEKHDSGKTILAGDIGVIGFYSKAYIYDAEGLVTPIAKKIAVSEQIKTFRPDYLFLTATRESMALLTDSVKKIYVPVMRFSPEGKTTLSLDTNDYPLGWMQDYILLGKQE